MYKYIFTGKIGLWNVSAVQKLVWHLNTQYKFDSGTPSYGIHLDHQNKLLDKMSTFIPEMRVNRKKKPFVHFKKVVILYFIIKYILFYYLIVPIICWWL